MEMSTKESFYIPAGDFCGSWREKASKVVDDSRGKFWWIGRRRRGSLESCESAPLLHLTSPAGVLRNSNGQKAKDNIVLSVILPSVSDKGRLPKKSCKFFYIWSHLEIFIFASV